MKLSRSKDPAPLKKSLENIEKKLIISNSSKMKPQLNVSKARQAIPAGFLKKRVTSKKCNKLNFSEQKLTHFDKTQLYRETNK